MVVSVVFFIRVRQDGEKFWNHRWASEPRYDDSGEHWHAWGDIQIRPIQLADVFIRDQYAQNGRHVRNAVNFTVMVCVDYHRYIATMELSRRMGEVYALDHTKLKTFPLWEKRIGKSFLILYCAFCMTIVRAIEIPDSQNPFRCR